MEAAIFKPVEFEVVRWHPGPAAELLLEPIRDLDLPRRLREAIRRDVERILLMASGKAAYSSEKVKNNILGQVAMPTWGQTYWGIWTTAAGTDQDASVGNTAGEVSGGAYDRVNKANNTTNFASITGDNAKLNSNDIIWPAATADWNAGATVKQLLVFDGNLKTAADNLLVWGDFTVAKTVLNGDTAKIATSDFSYTDE